MRHCVALTLLGVAAVVVGGQACGGIPTTTGPSVLLVVVDTLRADRLGLYGWTQTRTSPGLDRFAESALVYEQAVSPAPFTMPSMASALTGVYPDRAGVVNHTLGDSLFNYTGPTLAELLQSGGYRTGAVVANGWLKSEPQGFGRGFEAYVTSPEGATSVTDRAVELLEGWGREPFFLWAHYIDPHMPYAPPPAVFDQFGLRPGSSSVVRDFVAGDLGQKQEIFFNGRYPETELETTRTLYEAEIRHVDDEVGRLLDALDATGRTDETIVIVMSDHGESLGDHGLFFAHDFTLYEELVRVALMVRRPGVEPDRFGAPVSLVDVVPSVCRWLVLVCPETLDGVPLPHLRDQAIDSRALFAAAAPWRAQYVDYPRQYVRGVEGRWTMVRRGDLKVIKIPHPAGAIWEAYDLARDPIEALNLFEGDTTSDLGRLQAELLAWERSMEHARPVPLNSVVGFDREVLMELRRLGYIR